MHVHGNVRRAWIKLLLIGMHKHGLLSIVAVMYILLEFVPRALISLCLRFFVQLSEVFDPTLLPQALKSI